MVALRNSRAYSIYVQTLRIAAGSAIALFIAQHLALENATSASIITMLTILTTKRETLQLSLLRIGTFLATMVLCWCIFLHVDSVVLAFFLFLLALSLPCQLLGLQATISVNAVMATHFLVTNDFSIHFILNEFYLVLIGTVTAAVLQLLLPGNNSKATIVCNMRNAERQLQQILTDLSNYLLHPDKTNNVWMELDYLQKELRVFRLQAYEYQGNRLQHHGNYYVAYFEMRQKQCGIIATLETDFSAIRGSASQAKTVSNFILQIKEHILECHDPIEQLQFLTDILDAQKENTLPSTREEFETRALLFHILLTMEQFILSKREFLHGLDKTILKKMHILYSD